MIINDPRGCILCGNRCAFLAVCGAFAALGDTVEEREKRTDEIAQWLLAEPKADGAKVALDNQRKERVHGNRKSNRWKAVCGKSARTV